jgi:hypothetical protein
MVRLPAWVIAKHGQLQSLRHQQSLRFHEPIQVDLDPIKAKEPIPMADDRQNAGRGALFRNEKKSSDRAPDYRGDLTLPDGSKLELAGWLREDRNGAKYLSISAKPFQERQQQSPRERYDQRAERVEPNRYAEATGRDDRAPAQPQPRDWTRDTEIPFAPEVR